MFCPQCGNSVNPSMNFCPYCSYPLKNLNINKDINNSEKKSYENSLNNYSKGITNNNIPSFDAYRESIKKEKSTGYEKPEETYKDIDNYNNQYSDYVNNSDYDKFDDKQHENQQFTNLNKNQNNSAYQDNSYQGASYQENPSINNNRDNRNAQSQYDNYVQNQYQQDRTAYNYNNKYNTSQNESVNHGNQPNYQEEKRFPSNDSYQVNNYPQNTDKKDFSYGTNIYSTKNRKSLSENQSNPLIPPNDYDPSLLAKTNKKTNHINNNEEVYYDFEEQPSDDRKFYNSWGFIIPMVLLLVVIATVVLHFLNIIDLTAIPSFFNKEPTEQTSSDVSPESSTVDEISVNDKNFYIEAGNIEEVYADKIYNLDDEVTIEEVSYFISVDEELNIKKDDYEYIIVNIKVENTSSKAVYLNPFYFSIVNEKGEVFSPHQTESKMQIEEILTNQRLNGSIPFKIPIGEEKLYIVFSNSENLDLAEFFIKYR